MLRDVRVIIVEDDPYARDLMTLLLARDWRTRVIVDLTTENEALQVLKTEHGRIDVIVYDTEIPNSSGWPARLVEQVSQMKTPPAILFTGTCFDTDIYRKIAGMARGGYVLKNEVGYTLAWAVVLVDGGNWVLTQGILHRAQEMRLPIQAKVALLNGTKLFAGLTDREKEIARLAILLNMARRNLADELQISPDWAFEMVSLAYQKLGLTEVLSGEVTPESYLEDNPLILESFRDILSHLRPVKGSKKGMDMDTLAFHLLTVPDVQELD